MAKLTIGQKSDRVLTFLRGLTQQRVAATLSGHGFAQGDWDEGWDLLRRASGAWLVRAPRPAPNPDALARLDAWENRWFPIAKATLLRRNPALHDQIFHNLSQTTGAEVAVSVSTFVTRVRDLANQPDGSEALTLLALRGITEHVLAEADQLLQTFGTLGNDGIDAEPPESVEARHQAEEALWSWYLEWSSIARTAIRDRRQLRALGFLRTPEAATVASLDDDEVAVVDEDVS